MNPDLGYEKELWKKGYKNIVGIDEVGRGAFAGPLVIGCVSFPNIFISKFTVPKNIFIRDSKKLTAFQRQRASDWITNNFPWSVGISSVSYINKHGMSKSLGSGIVGALNSFHSLSNVGVDYMLIDGKFTPKIGKYEPLEKTSIIGGDGLSMSIAAASIVAKVYRDTIMERLSKLKKYSLYMWDKNKGYGTKAHREALSKNGSTIYHRIQFVKNFI